MAHSDRLENRLNRIENQLENLTEMVEDFLQRIGKSITSEQEIVRGIPVLSPFSGGIFYRRSKPDADPFVEVGNHVNKEATLGIIEVAKTFTEILSPVAGTITHILLENGTGIKQKGQLLMIINPDNENEAQIIPIARQEKELPQPSEPEEESKFICSHYVGIIEDPNDSKSAWLVKIGDIISPNQQIVSVKVLGKYCYVIYTGKKPVRIEEFLIKEGAIVEYSTKVARVEPIKEEGPKNKTT